MSFSSGFSSGVAAGGSIRDRYDDRKKRAEDIKLALEKEQRQMDYERQMKAEQLKADLQKMGFGSELDLEKLKAQLTGQGELATADRAWRSGESAAGRAWQSGEAATGRAAQAQESAAERALRERQINIGETYRNAKLGLDQSALGWDMNPNNPRNQGRPDRSKMAMVKQLLDDGKEVTYDVPVEEFNQPPGPPAAGPSGLQGPALEAYNRAMANPNDPESKRTLQILRGRGLIK